MAFRGSFKQKKNQKNKPSPHQKWQQLVFWVANFILFCCLLFCLFFLFLLWLFWASVLCFVIVLIIFWFSVFLLFSCFLVVSLVLLSDCEDKVFPFNSSVFWCNVGSKVVFSMLFLFLLFLLHCLLPFLGKLDCFMWVLSFSLPKHKTRSFACLDLVVWFLFVGFYFWFFIFIPSKKQVENKSDTAKPPPQKKN